MNNIQALLQAKIAAKQEQALSEAMARQVAASQGLPKAQPGSEAPTINPITINHVNTTVEVSSVKPNSSTVASSSNPLLAKQVEIMRTFSSPSYAEAVKRSMAAKKIEAPEPKAKLSLAEKLAAKKAEQDAQALVEASTAALPNEVKTEEQEEVIVYIDEPKVVASIEDALKLSTLPTPPAPQAPIAVIETDQGFMSVADLNNEILRLTKLLAKINSKALQQKLAKLQEYLVNLETQIDLVQEAAAAEVGVIQEPLVVHDVFPSEPEHQASPEALKAAAKETFSLSVVLNERQLMAKDMVLSGKSFCLIGPAGTGKTTAQRSVAQALVEQGLLRQCSYKKQGTKGRVEGPSFVACAFTRRASANLARAIHKDPALEAALKHNIMTIHALLEFEPVIFFDPEKGRESMRFEPKRDATNPLEITHLVIEESSMLGLDLAAQLFDALPCGVQIIYIGDINQLPPVFGASILNYALVQLPVIELTEVYRNGGIILENAHNILAGRPLIEGTTIDEDTGKQSKFTIVRGKSEQQVGQERMAHTLGLLFKRWEEGGDYIPDEDMILSPFNKQALGTDNMNKWIAQFLGEKRKAIVYEILAGFNTVYLAVGDRVMVNKQDGYITAIIRNDAYLGKDPQLPGSDLSRFGMRIMGAGVVHDMDEMGDATLNYSNFNLDTIQDQDGERKQQASHTVEVVLESGETIQLSSAGDFGPQSFSLGYVLTVHKAQGCEFRKVFIIFHKDHSVMLSRELFYTAETRAREEVCLIAKDWVIEKATRTQRIKGNTLQDKIEYFNSGAVDMIGGVRCTK